MKFIFIGLCGISFSSVGSVLSEVDRPAKVCTIIQARVLIFDVEFPITQGYPVSFLMYKEHAWSLFPCKSQYVCMPLRLLTLKPAYNLRPKTLGFA